jgi:hypothetical protein
MFKSKFKLFQSISESELVGNCGPAEALEDLWKNLIQIFDQYLGIVDLSFFTWMTISVRAQVLIASLFFSCQAREDALDRIADILYSIIPLRLRLRLQNSVDDFVDCLIYPLREEATFSRYRKFFTWTDKCYGSLVFSDMKEVVPLTKDIATRISADYAAKLLAEKCMKSVSPSSMNLSKFKAQKASTESYQGISFQAKFQIFAFFSKPISIETVASFLESVHVTAGTYKRTIAASNGKNIFADYYFHAIPLELNSIPNSLREMIRHVAFVLTESPFKAQLDEDDPVVVSRFFAISRWFTPWLGIDVMDGVDRFQDEKNPWFNSGKDFIKMFKHELSITLKKWDLGKRTTFLSRSEIDTFRLSVLNMFSKTEFDCDMIDICLQKNGKKLVTPEILDILLYCIQREIRQLFHISIPEVPIPNDWLKEPVNPKFFTGEDVKHYPRWRQYAMKNVLLSETSNDAATLLILSFLKDPIASEIEVALEISKDDSSIGGKTLQKASKGVLQEVFQYLDKIFKFQPDRSWIESELYRNVQTVISGITVKPEKVKAKFASTWICDSFEEYMKIVSLF